MAAQQSALNQVRKEHPYRVYKREQEVISRHKIYRTTAFYTSYTIILLAFAIRSQHFLRALAFVPAGIVLWMLTEYFSHRFRSAPALESFATEVQAVLDQNS